MIPALIGLVLYETARTVYFKYKIQAIMQNLMQNEVKAEICQNSSIIDLSARVVVLEEKFIDLEQAILAINDKIQTLVTTNQLHGTIVFILIIGGIILYVLVRQTNRILEAVYVSEDKNLLINGGVVSEAPSNSTPPNPTPPNPT